MIPKVAIIGRPNVGKSSLLNMLAGRRVSIVDPTAGVTRDRVAFTVNIPLPYHQAGTQAVELIDTGGYGIEDSLNLTADVERQIAFAMDTANLIMFIVDGQAGVLPLDQQVAQLLRRRRSSSHVPVLIVANKVDDESFETDAYEISGLGFGEPVMVSANTRHGKRSLIEAMFDKIDLDSIKELEAKPDPGVLLAIVGKRNAGKSTLVNALAGDDRVIVSEKEGTTRDSVDVRFEMEGHVITAIDTAGVRKRKSMKEDIEYYSNHRALRSIRRADVVLLVIDATVPVSQVDKQLVNEIVSHFKPTVVVVNKWDLVEEDSTTEEFMEYFDESLRGLSFAPFVFVSAKNKDGLTDAIAMAVNLHKQGGDRVGTGELNRFVEQLLAEHTPSSRVGKRPKIYYVTQLGVHPPTIGLFVNDPDLFTPEYQRFLINRFRDELPYSEVPIQLLVRQRKQMPKES